MRSCIYLTCFKPGSISCRFEMSVLCCTQVISHKTGKQVSAFCLICPRSFASRGAKMVSVFGSVDCLMMPLLWSSSPRQSSQNYCIRGRSVSRNAGKGLQKERLEIPENTECKPFYCCYKKKRSQLTAASPDELFFLDFKTSQEEPVFFLFTTLEIYTQSLYHFLSVKRPYKMFKHKKCA